MGFGCKNTKNDYIVITLGQKKCRFGDSRYMKIKDTLFTTAIGDITKADAWMGI